MARFFKFSSQRTLVRSSVFAVAMVALAGCQTTQSVKPAVSAAATANAPIAFNITGKIGITSVSEAGKQAGSAFYAWGQQGERFAIDLTGALGLGATSIRYDGQTAVLSSERTGEISADSPERLLLAATGWQAPISQLPYWVLGRSAPSDDARSTDESARLATAKNGAWTAQFDYRTNETQPYRLRITHDDGSRVVMTINHTP
ncbi:outer membrane lipoprotein LolB [Moraxella caviae]|uniref:Outer-membrane lipoprotein LolB n=2 Tax=Moraxella caviae TaxID=34060 RepID=A0A1T0A5A9_9GAMM|nr:outer membrane lipoprotein LolB [Moraxella caviae]STZ10665.1 Outer-membrane lipoprotein lolB precursor [Moraxella caviae]